MTDNLDQPDPSDVLSDNGTEEVEEPVLDVFSLNRVPPKRVYTMKVRYKFIGRGQPRRYDFGDLFDDEESSRE